MYYKIIDFTLPNWSLSALINGDFSGLESEDINKINSFTDRVVKEFGTSFFSVNIVGDKGFMHRNDIDNLGADCSTGTILVSKN